MVATTGVEPLFVAVKAGRLPVPAAARPIEVSLFVQSNDVAVPENTIEETEALLQTPISDGFTAVGVGSTYTTTF
jgi:hypothetical protein